ncbi:MAG TPA: SCO family protein [Planctomycetota bacterium]
MLSPRTIAARRAATMPPMPCRFQLSPPALPLGTLLGPLLAVLAAGCAPGPPAAQDELPIYSQIKDFQLTDQAGEAFGRNELLGRVWVVDFIFTRCPSVCSELSRRMRSLAWGRRKDPRVGFLSISVDPDFDRPEVLAAYAAARGADPGNWTLATGTLKGLRELVNTSFLLPMGEGRDAAGEIAHSSRFVLLDRAAQVRGFYSALEDESTFELQTALDQLLASQATAESEGK